MKLAQTVALVCGYTNRLFAIRDYDNNGRLVGSMNIQGFASLYRQPAPVTISHGVAPEALPLAYADINSKTMYDIVNEHKGIDRNILEDIALSGMLERTAHKYRVKFEPAMDYLLTCNDYGLLEERLLFMEGHK